MFKLIVAIISTGILFGMSAHAQTGARGPATKVMDFTCQPATVNAAHNRVGVRCRKAAPGSSVPLPSVKPSVIFFSVPHTQAQFADSFLSLATTALITDRVLIITYRPSDTSGKAFGCVPGNCRKVIRAVLR